MAITEAQTKQLLISLVGDVDPATGEPTTLVTGIVAQNITTIWNRYAGYGQIRQELYARRDAIELVLSVLAPLFDTVINDETLKRSQVVENYRKKQAAVVAEIDRIEVARRAGKWGSAVKQLTTIEPTVPVRRLRTRPNPIDLAP